MRSSGLKRTRWCVGFCDVDVWCAVRERLRRYAVEASRLWPSRAKYTKTNQKGSYNAKMSLYDSYQCLRECIGQYLSARRWQVISYKGQTKKEVSNPPTFQQDLSLSASNSYSFAISSLISLAYKSPVPLPSIRQVIALRLDGAAWPLQRHDSLALSTRPIRVSL